MYCGTWKGENNGDSRHSNPNNAVQDVITS